MIMDKTNKPNSTDNEVNIGAEKAAFDPAVLVTNETTIEIKAVTGDNLPGQIDEIMSESTDKFSGGAHLIGGAAQPSRSFRIFNTMLGVVGELFITIGVLIGLFVVWQLWWTNLEAYFAQTKIYNDYSAKLPPIPGIGHGKANKIGTLHGPDEAPPVEKIGNSPGIPIGIIRIPKFGDDFKSVILQSTSSSEVLGVGSLGHYVETALPGEIGNFAIAGHRQSSGGVLLYIDSLKNGDVFIVETPQTWLVYKIYKHHIVKPSHVSVLYPVPEEEGVKPTKRLMTVTTCHPLFSTRERWIVHAELLHWTYRKDGVPPELKYTRGLS